MFWHKHEDKSFVSVAIAMIFIGAIIFVFGVLGWWVNVSANQTVMALPSSKVMGGLIIMGLGYIQLELGLLRNK